MQTQPDLRRRIDKVLRKKEVSESRKAHGKKPEKQPKEATTKDDKGASGGGAGGDVSDKVKAQLSHKDRQLSGLAAQVKSLGGTPVFIQAPKGKGNSKGKKSRSRSSRDSGKKSDAGNSDSSSSSGKGSGKKAKAKAKAKAAAAGKAIEDITCYNCNGEVHYANKCPHPRKRGSPGNTPPGSPRSSPPGSPRSPRSNPSSSSNGSSTASGPINKVCHFHRPWRSEANGGPKTCTQGTTCRYIHASSEQQYNDKLKAKRKVKGTSRGHVARTPSGFLLAAALGAAFPNIADSTAVTGSSSLLHGSLNDVSSFGPARPQWAD